MCWEGAGSKLRVPCNSVSSEVGKENFRNGEGKSFLNVVSRCVIVQQIEALATDPDGLSLILEPT